MNCRKWNKTKTKIESTSLEEEYRESPDKHILQMKGSDDSYQEKIDVKRTEKEKKIY